MLLNSSFEVFSVFSGRGELRIANMLSALEKPLKA